MIFYCTSHFKLYNVYTLIIVLHNSNVMKMCTLVIINIDRDDNDDKLYSKFKKDLKLYNVLSIYITDVICDSYVYDFIIVTLSALALGL